MKCLLALLFLSVTTAIGGVIFTYEAIYTAQPGVWYSQPPITNDYDQCFHRAAVTDGILWFGWTTNLLDGFRDTMGFYETDVLEYRIRMEVEASPAGPTEPTDPPPPPPDGGGGPPPTP
jgi:hypothetical protein